MLAEVRDACLRVDLEEVGKQVIIKYRAGRLGLTGMGECSHDRGFNILTRASGASTTGMAPCHLHMKVAFSK